MTVTTAEQVAALLAAAELDRHGLRDSSVGLTRATLEHAYLPLAQRIVTLVRAEQPDGRGQLETLEQMGAAG